MLTLNCKGRLLVSDKPIVMGIINLTPDSFYAGSRIDSGHIIETAGRMLNEGATILDLGGQSTRPGSKRVSAEEEMQRVIPAVEIIHDKFPAAFISIDTFYAPVAREAVGAGASIINDISAGTMDEDMIDTVAELKVPYVLMHMQGEPQTMQADPVYNNVSLEVLDFFSRKKDELLDKGITDIIIDPGFGFGKTINHNFQLLKELEIFSILDAPLLVGLSRKATIYKTLGVTSANALNGTTVLNTVALMKGAMILRVHDVKEAMEAVKLVNAFGG
jgi:dihydropteroate synthase